MQISINDLRKLQKLARISLEADKEESFLSDISNIVGMLEQLQEFQPGDADENIFMGKTMHTRELVKDFEGSDKLLKNVEHEVINNSVVVRSVLNG